MPRSKLEKYLSILEALVPQPLDFDSISYKANMECSLLKRYIDFLLQYKLVEERALSDEKVYAITERGLAVFKTLQAHKYFKRLQRILPVVKEASEVEPLLSRYGHQFEEEN